MLSKIPWIVNITSEHFLQKSKNITQNLQMKTTGNQKNAQQKAIVEQNISIVEQNNSL